MALTRQEAQGEIQEEPLEEPLEEPTLYPTEQKYVQLLDQLKKTVITKMDKDIPTDYFTPHGEGHCQAVDTMAKAVMRNSHIILNELERFLLFASIWTHDLGMIEEISADYFDQNGQKASTETAREVHDEISAWFINKDDAIRTGFLDLGVSEDALLNYIHTINIISRYHRRKYDIHACPRTRHIKNETVNIRLLACILRLSDTLHVDSSRWDRKLYRVLQIGNFDRVSRMHWVKSYVVSAVHLDIKKQTIQLTIDLPEQNTRQTRLNENIEQLKLIIHENVYEDIVAVAETFRELNLPFYQLVKIDVHFVPGFDSERKTDVEEILTDLDILLSPNTSKVIEKTLDSITALTKIDYTGSYQRFHSQASQLILHLEQIFEVRPCHVGLGKIIEMLKNEFSELPDPTSRTSLKLADSFFIKILAAIKNIRNEGKASTVAIYEKAGNHLKGIEHVFLFGLSSTVSGFLDASPDRNFKHDANLYIFECSGKRQLTSSNKLQYCDGLQYALRLSKLGFEKITVLPDTSFAPQIGALIHHAEKDNAKDPTKEVAKHSLLLFGANGIDAEDKSCGHTAGHLMLSIVAEHYGIPVKIVADSFKEGEIEWNPLSLRKGTSWLSSEKDIIKKIDDARINLISFREDRIPKSLIDEIITEAP